MPDHYHCPGPRCYWRIQYGPTCSRCNGPTVQQADCCGLTRPRSDHPIEDEIRRRLNEGDANTERDHNGPER